MPCEKFNLKTSAPVSINFMPSLEFTLGPTVAIIFVFLVIQIFKLIAWYYGYKYMDKNFIIGIPLRDFRDPMTRLSSDINLDERINLMKHMFLNIVKSFQETNVEIFSITKDSSVIDYSKIGIESLFQNLKV